MKKEDIVILAQLLSGIKDSIDRLEEAQKRNDLERFGLAKKEILNFQEKIEEILKND